ncbi:succinate dehydrogenase, hydrophobic membrane anchor protein [Candidatus Pantoea edessiphila]|uniref:Succinate dehydrogenase hydrophobic membrane anchor subunit n=1 Tax=Candidatus Pantoea edessiphila TaxID=2044610 RepID=A0A2P5SZ16_9GAMM|nr:succinate dehydrogenase, hydrophobic membrane anchor protein [Candidatus Pantoea edessiphila]MBK4775297.1 succinate dehydrogenase, hydrophobic membrane anchor protein [Pantoea sp. Edef]PPI87565.1 succinate dehydrogenase, hydrophobic membrane anchor protein [Candidatus Pantoea edessiphila]
MVNDTSALGRNGIRDWLILRVAAIVIFLYIIYLFVFLIRVDKLNYCTWHIFFEYITTKIFTILMLLSVLLHGWIGIWQVLTDYVKRVVIRIILQVIIVIILLSYAIFGFIIVCGG